MKIQQVNPKISSFLAQVRCVDRSINESHSGPDIDFCCMGLTGLMENTSTSEGFLDNDHSSIRIRSVIGSKVPVAAGFRHDKVQLIFLYVRFQNSTKSDLVGGQPIYKWFVLIRVI
ncbi:unnamed protein product [Brassica oleracea var. botrytis]